MVEKIVRFTELVRTCEENGRNVDLDEYDTGVIWGI